VVTETEERWQPRDLWLGLLFFGFGCLIAVWVVLAARNGMPLALWGVGVLLAPVMLLVGGNALWKSLRSRR
jgi:hypothetical protein